MHTNGQCLADFLAAETVLARSGRVQQLAWRSSLRATGRMVAKPPSAARYIGVLQRSVVSGFGGGISALDREALHILHTRLEPADRLPLNFGPWWDSGSLHIHGNGPFAGFGVALRNGYGEPWAYGDLLDGDLADSTVLSGWVTWTGTLLGLTPDAASVRGDARVGIDLELMSGRVDFTDLESWAGVPLAAGTGRTWGDGSLGYAVAVSGNTFRETDGDVGRLSGVFTGIFHEGVPGILERPDLTAAFGGAR